MRHTMKRALTALACLALIPAAATAHEVCGPYPGTVMATTYTSSGAFHGAVDIASGDACGYWGVQTGVVGSVYWNITINLSGDFCSGSGSGSGNQNEAKHVWADGWVFRLWHWNKSAASYDRTCDRCQIGDEGGGSASMGPKTHMQHDKSGTLDSSWYGGYTTKGELVSRAETLGFLD